MTYEPTLSSEQLQKLAARLAILQTNIRISRAELDAIEASNRESRARLDKLELLLDNMNA